MHKNLIAHSEFYKLFEEKFCKLISLLFKFNGIKNLCRNL